MNLRSALPPLAPLAVALAATFVAISLTWSDLKKDTPDTSFDKKITPEAQVLPQASQSKDNGALVTTIEARPLFAQGRRNPDLVAPPIPVAVVPVELPDPVIVAEPAIAEVPTAPAILVVGNMSSGDIAQVLVRNSSDNSERWLKVGDEIDGWALVEITQDTIYLGRGEAKVAIKIFE